jgi:hypothetical protein
VPVIHHFHNTDDDDETSSYPVRPEQQVPVGQSARASQ